MTKLQVSQPDDALELEADRMAELMMRMPGPAVGGPGIETSATPALSLKRLGAAREDEELHRKTIDQKPAPFAAGLDKVDALLRQGGQPLDKSVRNFFEPRFGRDFGDVRIHTGSQAADSARAVKALAYTVGRDVVFNSGEYAPHSDRGKRLLAHELTHVVQQTRAQELVQRSPTGGASVVDTPVQDPLDNPRTKWVDALPMGVRSSIDNISQNIEGKMRELGRLAAGGKASKRLTAAEKADPQAALAAIRSGQAATWATNRDKFMDYMAPSLGGDDGVKTYFSALVEFGSSELFVHPEVARRLERVQDDLGALGLPMPRSSVGYSVRGDHLHDKSKRKRKSQGMLAHAMGLAIDYFAYKNVHLTDARVRALLQAVTGRLPHMELPEGALHTIKRSGEARMGKGSVDEAKWKAVENKIGEEFDSLVAASNAMEQSLGPMRSEVVTRHEQLMALRKERTRLEAVARHAPEAKRAAARAAADEAEAAVAVAEAALRSRLPVLFGPWLNKIDARIKQLTMKGASQGVDLEQVSTDQVVKDLSGQVRKALKPGKARLSRAASKARQAAAAAAELAFGVDSDMVAIKAARTPKYTTSTDAAAWSGDLEKLRAAADVLIDEASGIERQASDLLGAAPSASPKVRAAEIKRFRGGAELDKLKGKLANVRAKLAVASESLTSGRTAAADAPRLAQELRERKTRNAEIRSKVGQDAFEQLQEEKRDLFWLRAAASDLVKDLDFMFKDVDVKDPGAVQLVGGLDELHGEYGGGGFFGPNDRSVGTKPNDKFYDESGFNRRFFQTMAAYGFEIAASWTTTDAMHFELEALVEQIVPPDWATANPNDASAKGKAFVESAAPSE